MIDHNIMLASKHQLFITGIIVLNLICYLGGFDHVKMSPSKAFWAKEMHSTVRDETAKQRRRRDTTVEYYSIELVFVLDFTIYD